MPKKIIHEKMHIKIGNKASERNVYNIKCNMQYEKSQMVHCF